MYNRNIVKVKIADASYYLRNAKFYFKQKDTGRCIIYLGSVKRHLEETIKIFKKF